jgi:PTH1 family peptidyl-tRNA hydrolase
LTGNPGSQYRYTRHNYGWMLADVLTTRFDLVWKQKFNGQIAEMSMAASPVRLLKPAVFMNRSGESVQAWCRFYRIDPEEILVAHDDIELSFGRVELKKGGGLAGHNGLRSIVTHLGTQEFLRLRLGISRPPKGRVSSYVLSAFNEEERAELPGVLDRATEILISLLNV